MGLKGSVFVVPEHVILIVNSLEQNIATNQTIGSVLEQHELDYEYNNSSDYDTVAGKGLQGSPNDKLGTEKCSY